MPRMILYISKNNIEQVYIQQFGNAVEEEVTESSGKNNTLTPKISLSKLLGLFVDVSVQGDVSVEKKNLKTTRYVHTHDSKTLDLISQIEDSDCFEDIINFSDNDNCNLYKYNLPIKFSKQRQQEGGPLIKVTHESENLIIEGYTSLENWGSNSLVYGLILNNDERRTPIQAKGLLVPLNVRKEGAVTFITCQFLLVYL